MNFSIHGRAAAQAINRCDSDAPESRLLDTLAGGRQSGAGDISKPSVTHRTLFWLLATAVRKKLRGMHRWRFCHKRRYFGKLDGT